MPESMSGRDAESIAEKIVVLLAFLIPTLVIPMVGMPFQFTKVAFALFCVVILVSLYAAIGLKRRALSVPLSTVLMGLLLLPIAYLVSSLFSVNPATSLFGQQLDADTFGFIALASVLAIAVSLTLKTGRAVFTVLMAFFVSAVVVFVFQLMQVLLNAPLPISAFDSPIVNLIGKWNDFALFAGLVASMLLVTLESLELTRVHKLLTGIVLLVALGFLAVVNFQLAWILIGAVAFTTFVFSLVANNFSQRALSTAEFISRSALPLVTLLVSLYFLFAGVGVATSLQQYFATETLEVRPSVEGTRVALESVYAVNPIFGSGPNTFSEDWLLYRPQEVLQTPFWNVSFGAGFGTVPTAFITGGLITGLAWIILILLVLYAGGRAFFMAPQEGRSFFLSTVLTVGVVYLLAAHVFYVPSQSMTLIMFLFIGLLFVTLRGGTKARSIDISFSEHPRAGFVSVLLLVIALVVSLASLFGVGRVFASVYQYEKAIVASVLGDRDAMESRAISAINFSKQDRYYRTLALSEIARLNELVSSGLPDQSAQDEFRVTLANAINAGQRATGLNPERYENWFMRALTYASVVPLGISGAYENAAAMFEEARKRNPGTPEIDMRFAEMEIVRGDAEAAESYIKSALAKKPDFTPAVLLLGEIALDRGNLAQAIRSVEAALYFDQQNPLLYYQLGVLNIANRNFEGAAAAFEGALIVDSSYANAQFFLGQAYTFLGRYDDALALMRDLELRNPGNQLLAEVIAALQKEENPFQGEEVTLPPEEAVIE